MASSCCTYEDQRKNSEVFMGAPRVRVIWLGLGLGSRVGVGVRVRVGVGWSSWRHIILLQVREAGPTQPETQQDTNPEPRKADDKDKTAIAL